MTNAVPPQTWGTIYQCVDQTDRVIFTDSPSQLEKCFVVTLSRSGAAHQPTDSDVPAFDPNVPLIQVPTEPGHPPKFVPAPNIDPESNPFTTTRVFPQVAPPKMSPDQVGTPQALPPRIVHQPPPSTEDSGSPEPPQEHPLRSFNPLFPIYPTAPSPPQGDSSDSQP